jgi:hypothetical protein
MEPQWRNRIISEFSMPVQDSFDGFSITNLGGCRLGLFCGCLNDLSLTGHPIGLVIVLGLLLMGLLGLPEYRLFFVGSLVLGGLLGLSLWLRHR